MAGFCVCVKGTSGFPFNAGNLTNCSLLKKDSLLLIYLIIVYCLDARLCETRTPRKERATKCLYIDYQLDAPIIIYS